MKKAKEIIKGFFTKDIILKVFSLIAAIALWFVVMNTLNPTEVKTFTADLTFINESVLTEGDSSGVIITNKAELEKNKVTIKVRGTRPALDELSKPKNKAEIKAYVDLKQLNGFALDNAPQTLSLVVTPKLPDNIFLYSYEIVSCTPKSVDAELDRLKSETMKLQLNVNGELKSGYDAGEPVCETDTVRITGPESMFNKVASVRASVDVTGKTSDVNVSVAPAVYDTEGNIMELFSVEPSVIDVTVSVKKQWQIPVKAPEVIGQLNENLVLESIEYMPKNVEVEGSIEDINKVLSIQVPTVDLSAIEHTQTFTYDIRPSLKGTDLQLKESSVKEITVTVTVSAKASRDITIKQGDFKINNLTDGLAVEIEDVNITIYGSQELLDSVSAKTLEPVIDLKEQGVGWHKLPFTLTLPENVEMRITPSATVIISNKSVQPPVVTEPETQTETESAEETHTAAENNHEPAEDSSEGEQQN